jgi:hypothetical protein
MNESSLVITASNVIDPSTNMALWVSHIPESIYFYLSVLIITLPLIFIGSLITLGLYLLIQHVPVSRIRAILPPTVAALFICIKVFIAPVFSGTPSLIHGIALYFLLPTVIIAMEVLTPWPVVQGRLRYMKPMTMVFLCGIGSFYLTMFDNTLWPSMGSEMTTHLVSTPTSSPLFSMVLLTIPFVVSYLRGVLVAAGWYLILLLFDTALVHFAGIKELVRNDGS